MLEQAGFRHPRDLLHHLPHSYEDRRRVAAISSLEGPGAVALHGRLLGVRRIFTRRRGLRIVQGTLDDGDGKLPVVWFNQPYLAAHVSEATEYILYGVVRERGEGLELVNPTLEKARDAVSSGRIVPVYPAIGGLGPKLVRRLIAGLLSTIDLDEWLPEPLPRDLLERYELPLLSDSMRELHGPSGAFEVEDLNRGNTPYHQRLVYSELLELRLQVEESRSTRRSSHKTHHYSASAEVLSTFTARLPFTLTAAQDRVLDEILTDLRSDLPMQRLLQGDVGSGKTVVAIHALLLGLESGLQGALMAPTELLAEQHFASLRRLIPERYRVGLFTSSSGGDIRSLASGEVHLAVGTHALIQETVQFARLGLAVIDEQQRFGVEQRRELIRKGTRPDLLVMSATPIPRSLALTAYGDLDLSVIDELPPGRRTIRTSVLPSSRRLAVYRALRKRLAAGGQAYVVLPFIEASVAVEAASLEKEGHEAMHLLAVSCEEMHGGMGPEERSRAMRRFVAGEVQVLVATTVIEVGVDVPSVTYIVIESAERFGLAQLHQLRGRVGRGSEQSYCVALHGPLTEDGQARLKAFSETTDGFKIAEADLRIRGPGDLLGGRQAGLSTLRYANLGRDLKWLERATRDAKKLYARSPHTLFGG